jgi:hypothetical protein
MHTLIQNLCMLKHMVSCLFSGHMWNEWYYVDETCEQSRTCSRCNKTEFRLFHDWAEWIPEKPSTPCNQIRACVHCEAIENRVAHEWSPWEYVSDGSCEQQRVCMKCKSTENRMLHVEDYVHDCARCGNKHTHEWEHVECFTCGGSGKYWYETCDTCHGRGGWIECSICHTEIYQPDSDQ